MNIEAPFHEGEIEVQKRLGLRTEAKQNSVQYNHHYPDLRVCVVWLMMVILY